MNDHIREENGNILIAIPETHLDPSILLEEEQWFVVLMIGEECRYLSQSDLDGKNVYMKWPLWGDGIHAIGDSLWVVEESLMDEPHNTIQPVIYTEPKES